MAFVMSVAALSYTVSPSIAGPRSTEQYLPEAWQFAPDISRPAYADKFVLRPHTLVAFEVEDDQQADAATLGLSQPLDVELAWPKDLQRQQILSPTTQSFFGFLPPEIVERPQIDESDLAEAPVLRPRPEGTLIADLVRPIARPARTQPRPAATSSVRSAVRAQPQRTRRVARVVRQPQRQIARIRTGLRWSVGEFR